MCQKMTTYNYVPRVTQLDALQLDEEVIDLFKAQIIETTKFFSPGLLTPAGPEIELFLRTVIYNYSIFKNGKTFGQQMLSLRYDDKYFSKSKKIWLYTYTIFLKYIKDRLILSYTSNRRAQNFLAALEKFQIIGDFFNLIRFLQNGRCSTLIEYFLNLEMISEKVIRNQFTDFAWTRELLWHTFIELFGVLAPYINSRKVRRIINEKVTLIFKKGGSAIDESHSNIIPIVNRDTKCVECRGNPIIPHFMGCKHVFCQYCLQSHKLENPQYRCPICGFMGSNVRKVPSG